MVRYDQYLAINYLHPPDIKIPNVFIAATGKQRKADKE